MLPQRILCPIDFSDGSRAALRAAVDLAKLTAGELTLMHSFRPPRVGNDAMSELLTRQAIDDIAADVREELADWREEAQALGATKVDTLAIAGSPSEEIVRIAAKAGVDAIVMGTHSRTGFARAVLGSVAEKVVRHAPCSVYVIRGRA